VSIAIGVGAQAVDPVCGMIVNVPDAQFSAERDGIRYVFCGPGCREQFTGDAAGVPGHNAHH
jgi:YHS domain-containing protein